MAKKGNTGAVYIFVRSGSTWSQQAKITATTPKPVYYFDIRYQSAEIRRQ
jgi:hypothetical protein